MASENDLKAVENGGRGWICTFGPCRVKAERCSPIVLKSFKKQAPTPRKRT